MQRVSMNTTEKALNGKAIYSPKGAAKEYGRVGCNFYTGCPHDCQYCYLKRGLLSHSMGTTKVALKKCFQDEWHALEVFYKELLRDVEYLKQTGIFFSFSTDPLIEQTRTLTLIAAKFAVMQGVPVKILTKAADYREWITILGHFSKEHRRMIAFGFTLTGCDDMEPGAPSNAKRIRAMEELHFCGFRTFASIEPVVNPSKSLEMIQATTEFCDLYLIGLRSGVKSTYYVPQELIELYCVVRVMHILNRNNFKVYWKESFRKYFEKHGLKIDSERHFVDADYNLFAQPEESIIKATAGDWLNTADAFNTIAQAASINPDIVDNIHNISKQIFEASCVDSKNKKDL